MDKALDKSEMIMAQVGQRVYKLRTEMGLSRRELSENSGVSPRYIAQMEAGEGNISISLLSRVADALNIGVEWFLWPDDLWNTPYRQLVQGFRGADRQTQEKILRLLNDRDPAAAKSGRICLIGLRGAGKSTLGKLAADALGVPFVELNRVIEELGGMRIAEIMALYGPEGYRQLEADALNDITQKHQRVIVAAAGGVVGDAGSFNLILSQFHSIWLKATPQEHMDRVLAQGDTRPIAGQPQAMAQLEKILANRDAAYGQADYTLDTAHKSLDASLNDLLDLIKNARMIAT